MNSRELAALLVDIHLAAGLFINALLLYAIHTFSRRSMGTYKYLLAVFAGFDVLLTIFHMITNPAMIIVDSIFGVVTDALLQNTYITILYCSCVTVPFALMNIHFIYRYWAICEPHLIALFSNKRFIAIISAWPIVVCAAWFSLVNLGMSGESTDTGAMILQDEYQLRYGKRIPDSWIVVDFWVDDKLNLRAFSMMMGCNVIMLVSFCIASTLACLTYLSISWSELISTKTRKGHLKLLYAVCAQTLVPLVYIPYFCVNQLAFLRLPAYSIDRACMQLTACFPAWDALVVITLIRDYRVGMQRLVWRRTNQVHSKSRSSTYAP